MAMTTLNGPLIFDQYWDELDDCPICQSIKLGGSEKDEDEK